MILSFLRNNLDRQTLVFFYDLLTQIRRKLRSFFRKLQVLFCFLTMSNSSKDQEQMPTVDPPSFNPLRPSIPISYPIKTLEDLASGAYFNSFHYPFNKSSVPLQESCASLPERPRLLVCHDMQGGYGDDKWVQGGSNPDAYAIWHWFLIDVFVYFSHSLVTLPPPCWTNTAHRHGVKVLGTFITEWDEGRLICDEMLATEESARMYAEQLTKLAVELGFDGWLINMEIKLDVEQIPNLKEFVSHLTQTMHSSMPGSLVIWYDAVTINGDLKWQDQLNESNKPFFDVCDGIFVNYTWKRDYPKLSAAVAGDRKFDVYMGIDVFGRNTYGGGQWNTNVALDVLKMDNVSAAIFAPGWVYETKQLPDFHTAQNRWWDLVEKSWGRVNRYPKVLPFYSNFDQGRGYHISVEGGQVTDVPWNNMSCQGFQPFLDLTDGPAPDAIQVFVDLKEASYNGGGNITFKGTLEDDAHFTTRLFQGELVLGNLPLHVTYSVKSEGDSILGLSLQFSSTVNETASILIAHCEVSQFSSKFNRVIVPHQTRMSKMAPGWVTHEGNVAMNGYILTEIHAVCYRPKPENSNLRSEQRAQNPDNALASRPRQYFTVLGEITIKDFKENSYFPPSNSWIVERQCMTWDSDSQGSRTMSVKIIWKLKDGNSLLFPKYNIFVEKLPEQVGGSPSRRLDCTLDYLGVAQVEAFYVSDLSVPPDASSLKFIVQVCGADGACQKLEDSPFFQLDVEGQ